MAFKEAYEQNVFVQHNVSDGLNMETAHFHDGYEIHFTLTDDTMFYIEDKSYRIKSGGLTLINDKEIHRTVVPRSILYERYIISFLPDYISSFNIGNLDFFECLVNRPKDFSHSVQLDKEQQRRFLVSYKWLEHCINDPIYGKDLHTKLALVELVLLCNEIFSDSISKVSVDTVCNYNKIKDILLYIRANLSEDLSLDCLCSHFYMSKSYLNTVFKQAVGMTPNEYIILARMMKAREYIKEGLPIFKVCELIGYSDESHFIRTFKKTAGVTPKQYAKNSMKLIL